MKRVALFSLALIVASTWSLYAQDGAAPPAEATAPAAVADSHTIAVEDFLNAMEMEQTTKDTLDQMLAMQIQQQPALAAYQDIMKTFLQKHLAYSAIKGELVELYKAEFTEGEIKELAAFYRTPIGQKAVKRLPALAAAGAQIGMQRVQANMGELQQAIAARQAQLQGQQ